MRRCTSILLALILPSLANAVPLEKRLMKAVGECHSMFDSSEGEPETLIKDIKNGYVRVAGPYPTCGCTCEASAAAFKTSDGSYRILAYEEWDCDVKKVMRGDDWAKVLPANLREELVPGAGDYEGDAVFFVRAEIPRHGTQLELSLGLLPIGARMKCPFGVCTTEFSAQAWVYHEPGAGDAAARLEAEARYEIYRKATHKALILKWNRKTGTFSVTRREPIEKRTFEEYLKAAGRWSPAC